MLRGMNSRIAGLPFPELVPSLGVIAFPNRTTSRQRSALINSQMNRFIFNVYPPPLKLPCKSLLSLHEQGPASRD